VCCEATPPLSPLAATKAILGSISDGVFTAGLDWRITSFNRAAEEITGVSRREAVGKRFSEVFRSSMCEDVIQAWLSGGLEDDDFAMAGRCGRDRGVAGESTV